MTTNHGNKRHALADVDALCEDIAGFEKTPMGSGKASARRAFLVTRLDKVIIALLVLSLFTGFATLAHATHFRYGHYTWKPTVGNSIEFTIQNAFRRNGYFCRNPATLAVVACTGPGGFPGVGDVFDEFIGGSVFNPGDGSPAIGSPVGSLLYLVTAIDPDNWLFALALDPAALPALKTTITHTYPATGTYLAFTDSCCRISSSFFGNVHVNNPDGGYRVETLVNVGTGNSPPSSTQLPIVICYIAEVCQFFVPAGDSNGDVVRFRLSTSSEASSFGPFRQPGPPFAPNAAAIDSLGKYTWNTTGATLGPSGTNTLYSTQVTIEDLNSTGQVKSKVALDFFIQLATRRDPQPLLIPPPDITCPGTQTAVVGSTLSFLISALSTDSSRTVQLNAVGLLLGATMTPSVPLVGNPVSSNFSWTPTADQVGITVVQFTARDNTNQQALCAQTINVLPRVSHGRMTGGGSVTTSTGVKISHGFELHCDPTNSPNNLEVNWNGGNNFHLADLTTSSCAEDPALAPNPPAAGFDTYIGAGTGSYNGVRGASAQFVFVDAGEPGNADSLKIVIKDSNGNIVLSVSGKLKNGNHQAHHE